MERWENPCALMALFRSYPRSELWFADFVHVRLNMKDDPLRGRAIVGQLELGYCLFDCVIKPLSISG